MAEGRPDIVKAFFESKGLEVIDMRSKGGCLWVVGDQQKLKPYIEEATVRFQIKGRFAEGKATRYRTGWYMKADS